MKPFSWKSEKNAWLLRARRISFEEVVVAMAHGFLLDVTDHPNPGRYPNQRIYIVEVRGYAYAVPFEEHEGSIMLKTIIPSRRATKQYLRKELTDE